MYAAGCDYRPVSDTAGSDQTALPAQKAANIASGGTDGVGNDRFTGANWAWMIVGGLIWILSLFGLYPVITQPELFVEP